MGSRWGWLLGSLCCCQVVTAGWGTVSGATPIERLQAALRQESEALLWEAERLAESVGSLPVTAREWAQLVKARSLLRQGLWSEGERELNTLLSSGSLSPLQPWLWQWSGVAAFQQRHYAEAEQRWRTALEHSAVLRDTALRSDLQQQLEYWLLLALLHQGHYQRADSVAVVYVQRYPLSPHADEALFFRALLAEMQGAYRQAATLLRDLRERYPCHTATPHALSREAYLRLVLQEYPSAIRLTEELELLLERLSAGVPGSSCEPVSSLDIPRRELLFVRAEAYLQQEQWEAAQQAFERFLQLYPDGFLAERARLQHAWLWLARGEPRRALAAFTELQQSRDATVAAFAALYKALALKASGDTAAAQQELLELSLRSDFPYPAKVLLELGQLAYEARRYGNARLNLEQVLREASDAPTMLRVLILLGSTYQQLGDWEGALRAFRMAEQLLRHGDTLLIPHWRRYWEQALLGMGASLVMLQRAGEALRILEQLVGEWLERALQPDEILFWLAEAYYQVGNLAQATQVYERLLLRYPTSLRREEALYGTAWCAFRTHQLERAAFWFDRLLQEFPNTRYATEALVRRADALYILKQYRQAAETYWDVAQRFPSMPEGEYAAYQYGYVLYRLRNYTAAEEAFRYFARTYPRSQLADEALYFLGWLAFQQQRYQEAIERFRHLLQIYPNSPLAARTWFAIGNAYYNMEQWQEALQAYRTVVEQYPNSPYALEAVKSVQYCLLAMGQTDAAYRWADTVAQRYPATKLEEEARLKRAELLFAQQRYDAALREYAEFARRYPYSNRTAEALYWAFRSALALGDRETARQLSKQLHQQFPGDRFATQSLLELAREEARFDPAIADSLYQQVEQLGDSLQRAEAAFQRGNLAYIRGDTGTAVRQWQWTAAQYPATEFAAQARYRLALYWRGVEQYDSLRIVLAPLAEREDELGAEALYLIGEAWMQQGRCDSAVIAFRTLHTKHPNDNQWLPLSLLHTGECYERMGENAAAIEAYRLVVALRPNDEYGRTARSRLNRLQQRQP